MRRMIYFALTLILCTCLAAASEPDLKEIRKTLDELADAELEKGVASISIALVKDGKVVMTAAWGHANAWSKTPATPETIYCTGSTFKAVTATAILQLAEQGQLALDDPANKHLGDFPLVADKDNQITVRMLLNHTSGLQPGAATVGIWSRTLPAKLNDIPGKLTLVSEPGSKWAYNNHAYAVAGLIIEQVSGEEYEDYIVKNVLRPLGVETSNPVRPNPAMVERMALPYIPGGDGKPNPVSFLHYDVYPAGDLYLTAEDMARFLAAHLNGGAFGKERILSEESVKQAHTPALNNYALGWGVAKQGDDTIISHGGGVAGFRTTMTGSLNGKVGAYVMSNSGTMDLISQVAVQMLAGKRYTPPKRREAIALEEDILKQYVGEYNLSGRQFWIRLEDGQLAVRLDGQGWLPAFPEAKDRLFLKVVDAQLTVQRDKDGQVRGVILHQNGAEREAPRVK